MLLFLHESLEDYIDNSRADTEEALLALGNIATGRHIGKHLVLGKRSTLKAMAHWSELGAIAQSTYRKIYADLTQSGQLAARFSHRVNVVANHFGGLYSTASASQTRIQVPVRHFRDNSLLQETMLLSENFRDTEVYERMAQFSARSLGFQTVHLRTYQLAGGGADTAEQYKRCQDGKNRFCICIVDSDRTFPGDGLKETALKVKAIDDEDQPLCMYVHTHGHELENYIPTSWYRIVTEDDSSKLSAVEFLERLETSDAKEARKYLDMKKGLRLKQVLDAIEKHSGHSINGSYWRSLLATLDEVSNNINPECLRLRDCQSPRSCECCVMVGFGNNIIDKIIYLLNNAHWRRLENGLCPITRSDWEALGGIILAWCCGAQAMFVV